MEFLNELKWAKGSGRDKDGKALTGNSTLLISDFIKAPCDLLIIPGDSRVEYKIDYPSDKSVVPAPGFLRNKGYVINCGFVFGLQIRFADSDKAPETEELEKLGFTIKMCSPNQCVDIWDVPVGSFSLVPYFNGLKIKEKIKENMKPISPFGEYGHQSMTVLKNGKGYTIFTANNVTMKEYDCHTFTRFAVYDIDEPEKARFYTVAAMGENGNITIDGVASLASLVDNGENIVCHCYGFVDGVITEFRRIFDIETETFGELEVCKILHEGRTYDFTNKTIFELFGAKYGLTDVYSEIGIGPYFRYNDEWYTWAYTGSSRFCGILFKTRDFLTFEFVMIPDESRGTKCEIIPYLYKDWMFVAFRRDYNFQRLEIVKYDMKTLLPLESIVLRDTAMRPYFYEYKGRLFLLHSPYARMNTSIVELSAERRFLNSKPVASIENFHICTPCPVVYNDELYLTFSSRQGSHSQIFISHFSPEMSYSEEQISSAFLKLLDNEIE